MQIREPGLEVCRVVVPCQPVHSRRGLALEREESGAAQIDIDVVQERGEPFLLPCSCGLPYAFQPVGHASPVLRPARVVLIRVPLGPNPSLHRLRHQSLGFVRRLPRYYGWV
jgi:hypothetical protein